MCHFWSNGTFLLCVVASETKIAFQCHESMYSTRTHVFHSFPSERHLGLRECTCWNFTHHLGDERLIILKSSFDCFSCCVKRLCRLELSSTTSSVGRSWGMHSNAIMLLSQGTVADNLWIVCQGTIWISFVLQRLVDCHKCRLFTSWSAAWTASIQR